MKTVLLSLLALVFLTGFNHLDGGFSGGGGGTTVLYKGHRVLIDLLSVEGYEDFSLKEISSKEKPSVIAVKIIDEWQNNNLDLSSAVSILGLTEGNVSWELIHQPIPLMSKYYLPKGKSIENLKAAAWYKTDKHTYSVKISQPALSELSLLNQIAVYIHESLRHSQIGLSAENDYFNERELQEATFIYLYCKSNYTLTMYINFLLSNQRDYAIKTYGSLQQLIPEACNLRSYK